MTPKRITRQIKNIIGKREYITFYQASEVYREILNKPISVTHINDVLSEKLPTGLWRTARTSKKLYEQLKYSLIIHRFFKILKEKISGR